jgi:hypothetical protein
MFLFKQILPVAIIPMMVAAAVSGFLFVRGMNRAEGVLEPLAVGIAYLAGHLSAVGGIIFPPKDTINWLPYFGLVAAVSSAFSVMMIRRNWVRLLIMSLMFASALRLLLEPKFQYGWSFVQGYCWLTVLTLGIVLVWKTLNRLACRPGMSFELPAFLLILCGGAFGALSLSGSLLLSQFVVVLGSAVLGSALVRMARHLSGGDGVTPVFSLLLIGILASGYFFAELPATSAVLIAFAPSLALVPISKPAPFAFFLRISLVSLPIVVALLLAFHSSPPLDY